MVEVHAVAVLLRKPKRMLQFDGNELLRILPLRQDGGAVTLVRVTAPPSSSSVQQTIGPLTYVRPWGR